MKKLIFFFFLATLSDTVFAQQNPVSWSTKSEKIGANEYKIIITANFSAPWHIYSQNTPDGGPSPTAFNFNKNPLVTFVGKPIEKGTLKTTHDKNFGVDVKYYSNKVDFVETVKIRGNVKTNITGTVNYEVCNDHECLPPRDESFSVNL